MTERSVPFQAISSRLIPKTAALKLLLLPVMAIRHPIVAQVASDFMALPEGAERFGLLMESIGVVALVMSIFRWHSSSFLSYGFILLIAVLFSGVAISKSSGSNLSAVVGVVLFGMTHLNASEIVLLSAVATWTQSWSLFARDPRILQQVLFRTTLMVLGSVLAEHVYLWLGSLGIGQLASLTGAAFALFFVNTVPPALLVAVREDKRIGSVWGLAQLSLLPYYVFGAFGAYLLALPSTLFGF